ncbi:TNF receptor-associated factor 3-like isoform X2 [Acropora palmata]|uniref:TNF receptor-associated factor 3-like isoform X2 n=1 Tax=Acropora palmata TaxID=6131 RepID=UPI003DA1692E
MPGFQLSSSDLEKIPSKYKCKYCKNVVRDPMQTPCAHFYCRDCLEHLKSDEDDDIFECKADGEKFKRSEVFPDGCVRKEIHDLTVHCPNKESGCEWVDKITSVSEHVAGCDFVEILCVFEKCNAKVLKSKLAQHLQSECSQRQIECDYCCQEMPFADLKVMGRSERRAHEENLMALHLNLLVSFIYNLKDQVGSLFNDLSPVKESVMVIQLLKSTVSQLVSQVAATANENRKTREEVCRLTSRLSRIEEELVEPDSIPITQRHSLQFHYQQITEKLADFKRQLSSMEEKFASHGLLLFEANQRNEEQRVEIARLKGQGESYRETLNKLNEKLDSLKESLKQRNAPTVDNLSPPRYQEPTSFDAVLIWKIMDVSAKIYHSYDEPEKSIYSPPFCTSRHGYKMCARIYLNGDGMGKGTHISLFFVIMRGEYDAILRWPFRQKVTFMLLDQDNVEHVIDAFRPDPNSSSFQRPRREANIASGCPLFFPISDLNKHAYIKDDTMFVKVIVDCADL